MIAAIEDQNQENNSRWPDEERAHFSREVWRVEQTVEAVRALAGGGEGP